MFKIKATRDPRKWTIIVQECLLNCQLIVEMKQETWKITKLQCAKLIYLFVLHIQSEFIHYFLL